MKKVLIVGFICFSLLKKFNFIFGGMCVEYAYWPFVSSVTGMFVAFCPFADSTPSVLTSSEGLYTPDAGLVGVLESFLWLLIARQCLSEGQS